MSAASVASKDTAVTVQAAPRGPQQELSKVDADLALAHEALDDCMEHFPDGLSTDDWQHLFPQWGPNELPEKFVPLWRQIMKHAWGREIYKPDAIPLMLWAAMIISLALEDWVDFGVICGLYLINASLAFHEEHKAGNAVNALKSALAPTSTAKRDKQWTTIPAVDLVPGDLVKMKIGDVCPADCVLVDGLECAMDQSSLTGESLPVTKIGGDVLFSGTILKRGEVFAYVFRTGSNTEFGKTAALINSVEQQSRFLRILNGITNFILICALLVNFALLAVELSRGQAILFVIQRALVLLVAAVPIATPLVCTATMAVGARKLAEEKAVVTRLSALEELSSMTILCSDKTGTLTLNRLVLDDPWIARPAAESSDAGAGVSETQVCMSDESRPGGFLKQSISLPAEKLLDQPAHPLTAVELVFLSAMSTVSVDPDAIDTAVRNAILGNAANAAEFAKFTQVEFVPFDPSNRRTTSTMKAPNGAVFKVCKGAPKAVLALSTANKDEIAAEVAEQEKEYASRGLRTLGVAFSNSKNPESGDDVWRFIGLLTLFDPPRSDTADVIRRAHELGVSVKMITGDARPIAIETARRLGMGDHILSCDIFHGAAREMRSAEQLLDTCIHSDGFAEAYPEDKYSIVSLLQNNGKNCCGMTGDGVNDAPALKKSNCGFAVAGATPAARGAADVVLTEEGLSVIISAIIRSRKVFERMKNYCLYRINVSFSLLFFFFIVIIFMDLSLPAIVVVLLALLIDFTVMTSAKDYVEPAALKTPGKWNVPLVLAVSISIGLLSAAGAVIILVIFQRQYILGSYSTAQQLTLCYMIISLVNQMDVFVARTRKWMVISRPGKALSAASVLEMIFTTLISVYWPLGQGMGPIGWAAAGLIWALSIILVALLDIAKMGAYSAAENAMGISTTGKDKEKTLEDVQREVRMRISKTYNRSSVDINGRRSISGRPSMSGRASSVIRPSISKDRK